MKTEAKSTNSFSISDFLKESYNSLTDVVVREWNHKSSSPSQTPTTSPTRDKLQRTLHWMLENPNTTMRIASISSTLTAACYRHYITNRIRCTTVIEVDFDQIAFSEHPLTLLEKINPFNKRVYYRDFVEALELAMTDSRIKGVILKLNSLAVTDLSLGQIEELRQALLYFNRSKKFSLGYFDSSDEMNCNEATKFYYLATACSEIIASPLAVVNIPGLLLNTTFLKRLLEKLALQYEGTKREEYKVFLNTFTEESYTDPHREMMQSIINGMNGYLVAQIAKERKLETEVIERWFTTACFTCKEALHEKVIDCIMAKDEVYEYAKQKVGGSAYFIYFDKYLSRRGTQHKSGTRIALIHAEGAIASGESEEEDEHRVIRSKTVANSIKKAYNDKKCRAIILRINSGGGSAIASDEIRHEILNAKKQGKKIIISIAGVAASGAYWISMDADKIVSNPLAITGSIGVFSGKLVYKSFMSEKLGITEDDIHLGRSTLFSPWHNMDDKDKQVLNKVVDFFYDSFLQNVANGRNMELSEVRSLAKGRIYVGYKAREHGLVDEIGGLSEAINIAKKELNLRPVDSIQLVQYPSTSLLRSLFQKRAKNEEERDRAQVSIATSFTNKLRISVFGAFAPILKLMNLVRGAKHTSLATSLSPSLNQIASTTPENIIQMQDTVALIIANI